MEIMELTKDNFEEEALKSDKPVLIDLWAAWCGPCKMLSPAIDEIAEAHSEIKVCKINVDEQPELAMAFNAQSIPMVVLLKEGKVTDVSVGFVPKENIEKMLEG